MIACARVLLDYGDVSCMASRVDLRLRCLLECHPRTPCAAVRAVETEIVVDAKDEIVVGYRIIGDLAGLRVPRIGTRLDPERLWEHTCCELFVAPTTRDDYVEWNFSPTGQCTRFDFSSYRRRERASPILAPSSVRVDPGQLRLTARAPLGCGIGDSARVSLTTVIEDATGRRSYWAMRHPLDQPDFHHREGFALSLTLSPSPAITDDRVESP